MSTTTGATEIIARAVSGEYERWGEYANGSDAATSVVADLEAKGMVIASAADVAKVPTADEIAAMRWISAYPFSRSEVASKCRAVLSAYLERVTG